MFFLTFWVRVHEPLGLELHPEVESPKDATSQARDGDDGDNDLGGGGHQELGAMLEHRRPHTAAAAGYLVSVGTIAVDNTAQAPIQPFFNPTIIIIIITIIKFITITLISLSL